MAVATVLGAAVTSPLVLSTPAQAAWPGANGDIYFVCRAPGVGFSGQDICKIGANGTGLANLTNTPALSETMPEVSRTAPRSRSSGASTSGS